MFYQNKQQTGGAAVKMGTGMFPGTLDQELRVKDAFRTFWVNAPVTIPFFNNLLSWDLMPGASITRQFGEQDSYTSAVTWSTRVAWYCFSPELGIVGEAYGSEGTAGADPEYKIGRPRQLYEGPTKRDVRPINKR